MFSVRFPCPPPSERCSLRPGERRSLDHKQGGGGEAEPHGMPPSAKREPEERHGQQDVHRIRPPPREGEYERQHGREDEEHLAVERRDRGPLPLRHHAPDRRVQCEVRDVTEDADSSRVEEDGGRRQRAPENQRPERGRRAGAQAVPSPGVIGREVRSRQVQSREVPSCGVPLEPDPGERQSHEHAAQHKGPVEVHPEDHQRRQQPEGISTCRRRCPAQPQTPIREDEQEADEEGQREHLRARGPARGGHRHREQQQADAELGGARPKNAETEQDGIGERDESGLDDEQQGHTPHPVQPVHQELCEPGLVVVRPAGLREGEHVVRWDAAGLHDEPPHGKLPPQVVRRNRHEEGPKQDRREQGGDPDVDERGEPGRRHAGGVHPIR